MYFREINRLSEILRDETPVIDAEPDESITETFENSLVRQILSFNLF